jgi:preprotein translocase subunit SecY
MFSSPDITGSSLVVNPGWGFKITAVITLTAGTAFIMWLGEQINERGIGNGISLIIFAGIVANFPSAVGTTVEQMTRGDLKPMFVLLMVAFMVFVIGVIIFFERGHRRIPVQPPKRVVGRKVFQSAGTVLPLRVNTAGVIPPIFASSLLVFPTTVAAFFFSPIAMQQVQNFLSPQSIFYNFLYVILIIFFCYFYTAIMLNPDDVAENLKKSGGYIPGIRPGKNTAIYIEKVLERITLVGSLYVSAVCVLPMILLTQADVSFYFGGTSLLIVVGVALDTVAQIESQLTQRGYEGFYGPRGSKFKGRRG